MSPTVELANILAPVINVVFLLFGGSFLPAPPPWFIWLKWISPINYAYSSLAENQFAGQVYSSCDASSSTQCYPTGDAVLQAYNLGRFTIGQNMGFLAAITLAFIAVGYIFLRWTARPRLRFI
ncbi:hypothetical protein EHS25_009016 [Saitozyma podzolica]|uniref:ABC-2 type transporter transmembrane domain-containing protein n=1 Tax=Saitozyma podzolica TaxID=1890683 RepID=A0A427YKS1_9TREE|nr:hypothetical protein EHS25_009016 [Saitozyma podzolica]